MVIKKHTELSIKLFLKDIYIDIIEVSTTISLKTTRDISPTLKDHMSILKSLLYGLNETPRQ